MPATPEVRTAVAADADAVRDLHRRSSLVWDDTRADLLAHPDAFDDPTPAIAAGQVRVAVIDGRIVGFSHVEPTRPGHTELEGLFTDPDQMRSGVGRLLVADIVATIAGAGGGRLEVTGNPNALGFYRAVGFAGEAPVATRFGPGVRMHLDVPSRTGDRPSA